MDKKLKEYKIWLKAQGYAENTQVMYLIVMKEIAKKINIDNLTENTITDFLLKLNEIKKPETISMYRKGIKAFCKFKNLIIKVPLIVKKVQNNELPIHFTEEEFKKEILPLVNNFQNPIKAEALFSFMFYTGLRRSEVANLKRKDIDLNNRSVKVFGKGKKIRVVGFTKKIIPLLKLYFGEEPEIKNAFNSSGSNIKKYCDKLTKFYGKIKITPHTFRHSFACRYILKGGHGTNLSKLLGHSSEVTTEIYTKLTNEEILKRQREVEGEE